MRLYIPFMPTTDSVQDFFFQIKQRKNRVHTDRVRGGWASRAKTLWVLAPVYTQTTPEADEKVYTQTMPEADEKILLLRVEKE